MVLSVVSEGETYGYLIASRIEDAGLGPVKGGSLYPLLNKLEADGALASEWRKGEGGPGRKFYTLTDQGRSRLADRRGQWQQFSSLAGASFSGRRQTMDNKIRSYTDRLTWELRMRGVAGEIIGDALAQVESHCAESGEDPRAAFGPARVYAQSFAPAGPARNRWIGYILNVMAGVAIGALIGVGVRGMISGEDVLGRLNASLVTVLASIIFIAYGVTLVAVFRHRIRDPRKDI